MTTDPITDEIAYLLTKPARYADLMGGGCDALLLISCSFHSRLYAAEWGEHGSFADDLRHEHARILRGYPHAVELAQRSLDARDEYAHRAGRAA